MAAATPIRTLNFEVSGALFAVADTEVAEVIRPLDWTRVPLCPGGLLGLATLRGGVLPVLSAARLLGRGEGAATAASRIVVMRGSGSFGLLVDRIAGLAAADGAQALDLGNLLAQHFAAGLPSLAAPGRPLPAGPVPERPAERTALLLHVLLGRQDYALGLSEVIEIMPFPQAVTAIPSTDAALLGVAHARSGVLPLILLRALLGLPGGELDQRRARVVVIRVDGRAAGLVVDRVEAVLRLPEDLIAPVPPVLARGKGAATVTAIGQPRGAPLVSILSSAKLLDSATADRLAALTQAASSAAEAAGPPAETGAEPFVVCQAGPSQFGLPVAAVDEVIRHPGVLSRLPHAPGFVDGLIHWRGNTLPVIDHRRRFAEPATAAQSRLHPRHVVIVAVDGSQASNRRVGVAVDSVSDVLSIGQREIAAAPAPSAGQQHSFDRVATLHRDGRVIPLLQPRTLLDADHGLRAGRPEER